MIMLFLSVLHDYFLWHYTHAFREIFHVWTNLLWFIIHFFSIPQLAKAWFAPFKRITEARRPGLNFEDLAGYIIINLLSRVVGAILRTFLIVLGMACLLGTVALGFVTYLVWIFLPLGIATSLVLGISFLFA